MATGNGLPSHEAERDRQNRIDRIIRLIKQGKGDPVELRRELKDLRYSGDELGEHYDGDADED